VANPLGTPSGRIEIFSETITGFGYDNCPGHPVWLPPKEWHSAKAAERFPLHLISNQPSTRLHSQLDDAKLSRESKVAGREPVLINSIDAASRRIENGDTVRVFNDRGACLAGAVLSSDVLEGVVQLASGAWYHPEAYATPGSLDLHGNPNMLTRDEETSFVSQGPSAQSALVEVERFLVNSRLAIPDAPDQRRLVSIIGCSSCAPTAHHAGETNSRRWPSFQQSETVGDANGNASIDRKELGGILFMR
jgi:biotin/methionine sulfoxide reductase